MVLYFLHLGAALNAYGQESLDIYRCREARCTYLLLYLLRSCGVKDIRDRSDPGHWWRLLGEELRQSREKQHGSTPQRNSACILSRP